MSEPAPNPSTPGVDPHPMREMFRIAGPTVAAMCSYTLMTFTDKWLCSHLGSEPIYVGAQGNGGLASWVPISFAHGVVTVVNTFTSQNLGAGRPERGPAYAWNAAWLGVAYWLVVLIPYSFFLPRVFAVAGVEPGQAAMASQYGRVLLWGAGLTLFTRAFSQFFYGLHRASIVMVAGVTANIANLILAAVFMFGTQAPASLGWFGAATAEIARVLHVHKLGVQGSAVGTVLATLIELAIPLCVFLGPQMNRLYGTRAAWKPSTRHIRELWRMGWPQGAMFGNEMICWAFFMVFLVSGCGAQHATAGWIAHQYMSLSFMPTVGISVAVTALVGKYQGMGRSDLAAQRAWLGLRVAVIYMGICGAIFALFPRQLMEVFIEGTTSMENETLLLRLGRNFLLATAAFQLFDGVAMTISGALRGAGDTGVPGVATLVLSWTIIVGGGLSLKALSPGLESMAGWIAAATYIAVLAVFLLLRFLSGRWKTIKIVREDAGQA
ncbi:MAG: MATE family efflux transporter [Phycisphaerales bacterium]